MMETKQKFEKFGDREIMAILWTLALLLEVSGIFCDWLLMTYGIGFQIFAINFSFALPLEVSGIIVAFFAIGKYGKSWKLASIFPVVAIPVFIFETLDLQAGITVVHWLFRW